MVSSPSPAREDEENRDAWPPFAWRLSVWPYAAVVALFVAGIGSMIAAMILAPDLAVAPAVAASLLAVPAMLSVRALRGPRGFRLTGETLELVTGSKRETVPLEQVIGVHPDHVHGIAPFGRQATVVTQGRTVSLPRWTSAGGKAVIEELVRRLNRCQLKAHAALPDAASWPRYVRAPQALRDLAEDSRSRRPGGAALLFAGPFRKHRASATGARRLFVFMAVLLTLLAVSIGARPSRDADVVAGLVGFAVISLVVALFTYARASLPKGREWLLVHEEGMAMVGSRLSGELDWVEVAKVTGSGSFVTGTRSQPCGAFYVKTDDGATIAVLDSYDAPIRLIRGVCEEFLKRRG